MIKAYAFQLVPPYHRLEKRCRGGGGSVYEDVHPALNQTDRFFRGNGFLCPIPIHLVSLPFQKGPFFASPSGRTRVGGDLQYDPDRMVPTVVDKGNLCL